MANLWFLLISAAVVAGDQILKHWVVAHIALGGEWPVIPGVLHLTYLQNTGAAYSMLQGMRWPLVAVSCLCSAGIIFYLLVSKTKGWSKVGMALVLGGAVGNLIDRIRLGFVVDMFEVEFIRYPVFNLADSCIVVGGILFCVLFLFFTTSAKSDPEPPKKQKNSAFPETGKLVTEEPDTVWTETKILEAYDLERMLEAQDAETPQEEPAGGDAESSAEEDRES